MKIWRTARSKDSVPVTVVLNPSTTDCGLACLKMILSGLGVQASLEDVRAVTSYSAGGVTVGSIIRSAKSFGVNARALRSELAGLHKLRLPAIIHWNFNHFVVLERISSEGALIVDPASGRRRVGNREFSHSFTGVAVEFETHVEAVTALPRASSWTFRPFLPPLTSFTSLSAVAFAVALLSQLLMIIAPIWMASLVDNLAEPGLIETLPSLGLFIAAMIVIVALAEIVQRELLLRAGLLASLASSSKLVDHLFSLNYSFFGARRINDMVARVGHIRDIRDLVVSDGIPAVVDLIFSVVAVVVLFAMSPLFGMISIGTLGIYAIIRLRLLNRHRRLSEDLVRADSNEMGHLIENLRSILTLKAANLELQRNAIWRSSLQGSADSTLKLRQLENFFVASRFAFTSFDQLAIVLAGVVLVSQGVMTFGILVAVLMIRQQLYDRVMMLIDRVGRLLLIRMFVYRLSDVMIARKDNSASPSDGAWTSEPLLPLKVRGVTFRYVDDGPTVLDDISLDVGQGDMIAIRGPSGQGKSTLVKVLLGLVDSSSGTVFGGPSERLCDGAGFRSLRDRSGVVLQGEQLFSGTILENISSFATEREISWAEQCAKDACVHDDIEGLPLGYYTQINEAISNFSGGQIQRILLARAFYRRPEILFLDEATSALDPQLEIRVVGNLRRMEAAKVCVTHRSLMLEQADIVYSMEGGRLHLEVDRRTSGSKVACLARS